MQKEYSVCNVAAIQIDYYYQFSWKSFHCNMQCSCSCRQRVRIISLDNNDNNNDDHRIDVTIFFLYIYLSILNYCYWYRNSTDKDTGECNSCVRVYTCTCAFLCVVYEYESMVIIINNAFHSKVELYVYRCLGISGILS